MNQTKSSTSVMFAGTASGKVLAPYIVFKAEHVDHKVQDIAAQSLYVSLGPLNNHLYSPSSPWGRSRVA